MDDSLSPRDAEALAKSAELRVVQTVRPLDEKTWRLLDERVFAKRPDVECRVYGHYNLVCDLSLTRLLPHVRRFAVDCHNATNLEALAELNNLELLRFAVFEHDSLEVLDLVDHRLHTLTVGQTRSKKPDLSPLARFTGLRTLYIEGHTKNIEVLANLRELEDVTLRSTTTTNVSFLAPLEKLWSLDIKLGGTTNLEAIVGKSSIKYLELWQVRGLANLDVVSELPGLQDLFLQSLPQVTALPSVANSTRLRRVRLETMKGLKDLRSLEHAPALEEFAYADAKGKDLSLIEPVLRNPSLRRALVGFGSRKKNDEFAALLSQYGKAPFGSFHQSFDYR